MRRSDLRGGVAARRIQRMSDAGSSVAPTDPERLPR